MKTHFWYRAEVEAVASAHGLDPSLVIAMCMQESAGRTNAFRHEPAFWRRYMEGKPEWDGANPYRVSSSYGLLQVMFATAVADGYARTDPPEHLFVPVVGLSYGCKHFVGCLKWSGGDVAAALAAYNGGKTKDNRPGVSPKRNQEYVDGVTRWLDAVKKGRVTT